MDAWSFKPGRYCRDGNSGRGPNHIEFHLTLSRTALPGRTNTRDQGDPEELSRVAKTLIIRRTLLRKAFRPKR